MTPIVLFRRSLAEEGEFNVCREYFPNTVELRSKIPPHSFVIPRYSCLPYYKELEQDLANNNSIMINSWAQHKWIANFEWYEILKDYTPESWTDANFYQCKNDCSFVVKGKTNSRKNNWYNMMYAENKRKALDIASILIQDGLIGEQGIVYRKYVPLETYERGIGGIPFTNEWRFFFYRTNLLACGYYWSTAEKTDYKVEEECILFARKLALITSQYTNFFVLDIAKTLFNPRWILIEINDASQSGLSECSANQLYKNLKNVLS